MLRAVFLDRDGVLNEPVIRYGKPHPPANVGEMQIAEGAAAALAMLRDCGFLLYVVSNQPDVARGSQTKNAVQAINNALLAELPLDAFYMCYHDDADHCDCRKPLPGLLEQASRDHDIVLSRSYLIGDRWRDVDAGAVVGCTTILIDRGYTERKPVREPDMIVTSIWAAAQAIISREQKNAQ
jgi:D-glycero-D-manno-heptose 1,7-bisphosphate phosphatase